MSRRAAMLRRAGPLATLIAVLSAAGCGLAVDDDTRLARGATAYAEGDYRAAVIDAKRILQKDPANAEARLLLGRSALQLGDVPSAVKELDRAVELGIDRKRVVVELGEALLVLGESDRIDTEITVDLATDADTRLAVLGIRGNALLARRRSAAAREVYRQILDERDGDVDTMIAVATSHIYDNELETARENLDEVIRRNPESAPALIASGALWALENDLERAAADLENAHESAVRADDTESEKKALLGLVEIQLAERRLEKARASLALLADIESDSTRVDYHSAQLAYLQGEWERAAEMLLQIVKRYPEFGPAQLLLGAVQLQRQNFGQAEAYVGASIELMPGNQEARQLLAEIRLQQGKAFEAARSLQPLLGGGGADSQTLAIAARAQLEMGEADAAMSSLTQRVSLEPENAGYRLDLAATNLALGNVDDAERALSDLGELTEQELARLKLLDVVAAYKKNDYGLALELASELHEHSPDDARLNNLIGVIHLASNDRAAARRSFDTALNSSDSINLESLLGLARLDVLDGKPESAAQRYELALEMNPGSPQILLSLARLAASSGDTALARARLESLLEVEPQHVGALAMLAQTHVSLGDLELAERTARAGIALNPDVAALHRTLGIALYLQDRSEAAVESLAKAIELDPGRSAYRLELARAHMSAGQHDKAETVLLQALQSDPDDVESAAALALLYVRNRSQTDALAAARTLRSRLPDSAGAMLVYAEILYDSGRSAEGSRVYRDALAASNSRAIALRAYRLGLAAGRPSPETPLLAYLRGQPADVGIRNVLARDYTERDRIDDAIGEYETIVSAQPEDLVATNNLAWLYFQSGNADAETMARRAAQLAPDNSSVADTLGWILLHNGSVEEAIQHLRRAVENAERDSEYRFHLAAALQQAGEEREAREMLERLLDSENEFKSRDQAESLLRQL